MTINPNDIVSVRDLPVRGVGVTDWLVGVPSDVNAAPYRVPFSELPATPIVGQEIEALKAGQAAGQIVLSTWAQLAARTGAPGIGAQVIDDAGTHTDPVLGGTVPNQGQYVWNESPPGWKWVRPDALPLKADKSLLDETNKALENTGLRGLGVYGHLEQSAGFARDESGRLRVLYAVDRGRVVSYMDANGVTSTGALQALSYAGVQAVYHKLGPAYPAYGEYFRDESGRLRVRTALGNGYDFAASDRGGGSEPSSSPSMYYVVLCIGQSNMEGRGDSALAPAVPDGIAYWWNPTTEALDHLAGPVEDADTGSSLPAMCLEFWKRTGFGLIVVPAARGGTAVQWAAASGSSANWSSTGTLRATAIERFNACIAELEAEGICWQFGGTICAVGETDASRLDDEVEGVSAEGYYDAYEDLIHYFQTETGSQKAPFVITQTGMRNGGDTSGWQAIRQKQMDLARNVPGAFLGFTAAKSFPARGLMKDDLHYNQTGLNEMGRANGTVLAVLSIGRH